MRFKLGFLTGFGTGYYLGSKAGRERYRQLNSWLHKAKESNAVGAATGKARAAVDRGVDVAKSKAGERRSADRRSADSGPDPYADPDVDQVRPTTPLGGNGVTVPTPEI
jgi:hypothetical protein